MKIFICGLVFAVSLSAQAEKQKLFELEVNIGPVPVEQYLLTNTDGTIAGCPKSQKVSECLKMSLANYARQKVTTVRYMFDMTGDAFLANGTPNPKYISNLNLIHKDMKASGITHIIPTPNWDGWGNQFQRTVFDPCQGKNISLIFYKTAPYGFETENGFPYNLAEDRSYECSPANPIFVGWNNIYNLIDAVIKSAKDNELIVSQFDIKNEVNLHWFSVMGRNIHDNKHGSSGDPNVYMKIRSLMAKYGFSPGVVNYSTVATNVSLENFDCKTAYGDSGRVISQSALVDAIAGKPFGRGQNWGVKNKIVCGGDKDGMARLPTSNPLPDYFDIHDYHCIEKVDGSCDPAKGHLIKEDSLVFYNTLHSFLSRIEKPSATMAIGETHSLFKKSGDLRCEGFSVPDDTAHQMIEGFSTSSLRKGREPASNVIRPWNYIMDATACYSSLQDLSPYYNWIEVTPPPPVKMNPPVISAAGGGCNGCDCGWISGSGFYNGKMEVHLRKSNWDYLNVITTPLNYSTSGDLITFHVPPEYQNEFRSGGLRFTVVNPGLPAWETTDSLVCQ